jgi:hypothetical protein
MINSVSLRTNERAHITMRYNVVRVAIIGVGHVHVHGPPPVRSHTL